MATRTTLFPVVALFTLALGSACSHPSTATPPAAPVTTTAADDASAGILAHHRFHHHGGVTLFIAMSLDSLGVPQEKRARIEAIQTKLQRSLEPARVAEQSLMAALAEGVTASRFDDARIDGAIAGVASEATKAHGACAEALNELHDVLSPHERAALVDKVESHWQVWRNANEEGTEASRGTYLDTVAVEHELTPAQVQSVRENLATLGREHPAPALNAQRPQKSTEDIAASLRNFRDAFTRNRFDAVTLTTSGDANGRMAALGAMHMVMFVEAVSPVLTPEQRATFAQDLRFHASHDQRPAVLL